VWPRGRKYSIGFLVGQFRRGIELQPAKRAWEVLGLGHLQLRRAQLAGEARTFERLRERALHQGIELGARDRTVRIRRRLFGTKRDLPKTTLAGEELIGGGAREVVAAFADGGATVRKLREWRVDLSPDDPSHHDERG
jgi:hypothetical protein